MCKSELKTKEYDIKTPHNSGIFNFKKTRALFIDGQRSRQN
jgi:hypothetical protein